MTDAIPCRDSIRLNTKTQIPTDNNSSWQVFLPSSIHENVARMSGGLGLSVYTLKEAALGVTAIFTVKGLLILCQVLHYILMSVQMVFYN